MRTKKKIIKEQLAELESLRLSLREKELQIAELTGKVEDYVGREQAISQAMTEATNVSQKLINDANEAADKKRIESDAEMKAAKAEAEMMVDVAYQNARDIVKEANEYSRMRLEQTEASIKTYGELLGQYNNAVKDSVQQAESNAKRYAKLYQELQMAVPELIADSGELSKLIDDSDVELPDPDDDPAQLMKNIYSIEHRVIPCQDEPKDEIKDEPKHDTPVDKSDEDEPEAKEDNDEELIDRERTLIFDLNEDQSDSVPFEEDDEIKVYTVEEIVKGEGKDTVELDSLIDEILKMDVKK
ncbi:MAG: hypothetical protein PHT58_05400 [Eubacteriales bacterium]|nr:hypothetical protein [Eubacteriales bacterium]